MKTLVSGDFGILHEGHIDYIAKAYLMSDWLIIATHTDESIISRKNYTPIPLWARMCLLKALLKLLGEQGEVVLAKDTDGSSIETLRFYQPDVFAKGGGYSSNTMPEAELKICQELGIRIVYGLGSKVNQSRDLASLKNVV